MAGRKGTWVPGQDRAAQSQGYCAYFRSALTLPPEEGGAASEEQLLRLLLLQDAFATAHAAAVAGTGLKSLPTPQAG